MPGFEDAFYYAWRERRMPAGYDEKEVSLGDRTERERLGVILERGLERPWGTPCPSFATSQGAGCRLLGILLPRRCT